MEVTRPFWLCLFGSTLSLVSFVASGCSTYRDNTVMIFYGKLIDQNGAPVVGGDVTVLAERNPLIQLPLYWWEGNAPVEYKLHLTTDKDGQYVVRAYGYDMGITATARGYYGGGGDTYFYTADRTGPEGPYVPHADHPVVWSAWKLSGPHPLIEGGDDLIFEADGKPHGVDMLHNAKAPDGGPADFWITMPTPPADAWYKPYSWSYEIKAADGGIVPTKEQYPFIAPADGYVPNYGQEFKNVNPRKAPRFRNTYYLKCHNGQIYARVDIDWEPTSNPSASFRVSYVANPAGSRNLEPGLEHKPGR